MKFVFLCLSWLAINVYAQKEGAPYGESPVNVFINLRYGDKNWKLVDNWKRLPVKLANEYKKVLSSGSKRNSGHSYASPAFQSHHSSVSPGYPTPESPHAESDLE